MSSIRVLHPVRQGSKAASHRPGKLLLQVTPSAVALKTLSCAGTEPGVTVIWTHPWGGASDVRSTLYFKEEMRGGKEGCSQANIRAGTVEAHVAEGQI